MNLRSIGTRAIAAVGALGAVVGVTAAVAGAQTAPGRGPFASGMLTSISGSALELQRTNPQDQSGTTNVSVTLTGTTTYQMVQQTASGTIAAGACVRVSGKGSVDKGKITASTVAITMPTSGTCTRPGAGNGAGPGSGPGGGGSVPNGGSIPNGSNPRRGNARRGAGIAFGSVQSVKGNNIVVKAARFTARPAVRRIADSAQGDDEEREGHAVELDEGDAARLRRPDGPQHRTVRQRRRDRGLGGDHGSSA